MFINRIEAKIKLRFVKTNLNLFFMKSFYIVEINHKYKYKKQRMFRALKLLYTYIHWKSSKALWRVDGMLLNKSNYKEYRNHVEKIVQFGEGNFLRAFVDWIVDTMNKKGVFNGSAVVIQPLERGMIDKLNEQDGLYTLYLNGIKEGKVVSEHEVISSINRALNPYSQYEEYLQLAEQEEIRFVFSNTTEAGIAFNQEDTLEHRPQSSYPGKLTAFLYHRFKFFNGNKDKGLIVIPCELIDKNGEILKSIVLQYAKLWNLGEEFIQWVEKHNVFCNSLVDRIVPGYPKEKMKEITAELGYEDGLVVEGEQFHLWVIEGPAWIKEEFPTHKAGLNVLFVEDLTPYRTRKVRILNGAHTSMVPVAYLYGVDTVKEAVEHEVLGKFIQQLVYEEIIPTLDLSLEELESFAEAVLDRFKNPFIKHYLMSIALNSMSKFETRVLPSLIEYKNSKEALPDRICFSLAALMYFYKGYRKGEKIALADEGDILDLYEKLWNSKEEDLYERVVRGILSYEKLWKMDLTSIDGLEEKIIYFLRKIDEEGIEKAINEVIA